MPAPLGLLALAQCGRMAGPSGRAARAAGRSRDTAAQGLRCRGGRRGGRDGQVCGGARLGRVVALGLVDDLARLQHVHAVDAVLGVAAGVRVGGWDVPGVRCRPAEGGRWPPGAGQPAAVASAGGNSVRGGGPAFLPCTTSRKPGPSGTAGKPGHLRHRRHTLPTAAQVSSTCSLGGDEDDGAGGQHALGDRGVGLHQLLSGGLQAEQGRQVGR